MRRLVLPAQEGRPINPQAAFHTLNRLYTLLRWYTNFFQPVMKPQRKTRPGAKVHKVYDTARTPYQRLLEAGVLAEAKHQELAASYQGLNPVRLLRQINEALESLWALAERPVPIKYPGTALRQAARLPLEAGPSE